MEKEDERRGEKEEEEEEDKENILSANGGQQKLYPSPLLSHHELISDPALFGTTLRRFHSIMGTKFMVPVIGGKELDLRVLYAEVTERGGLEKVMADRRWREVIAVFRFPPTTTSASFVLRKNYVNLLHHFEQVHFHGRRGSLVPPPASFHARTSSPYSTQTRKELISSPQSIGSTSYTVNGTIEGKFEHGYLVTVNLGTEILRGVLYHAPPSATFLPPSTTSPPPAERRRRRRRRRIRDPAHPKPNRSAYNFFFADKHSKLRALYPNREREFSKMIGESWSKLTDEERLVYQDCGVKDKERYTKEMREYRERLKVSAADS